MSFLKNLFNIGKAQETTSTSSETDQKATQGRAINEDILCPYCGASLGVKPARKKKCPSCSQPVFVIDGMLLTQQQADTKRALRRLEMFDVTAAAFEKARSSLKKEFGSEPSANDVTWRILNSIIAEAKADENLKMVYYEMASLAKGEGKDPKPYQSQAIRQDLLSYKRMGVKRVQVFGITDYATCDHCRSYANKTMSLEKALKEMPLPGTCSSPEGCRCLYSPVIDD